MLELGLQKILPALPLCLLFKLDGLRVLLELALCAPEREGLGVSAAQKNVRRKAHTNDTQTHTHTKKSTPAIILLSCSSRGLTRRPSFFSSSTAVPCNVPSSSCAKSGTRWRSWRTSRPGRCEGGHIIGLLSRHCLFFPHYKGRKEAERGEKSYTHMVKGGLQVHGRPLQGGIHVARKGMARLALGLLLVHALLQLVLQLQLALLPRQLLALRHQAGIHIVLAP